VDGGTCWSELENSAQMEAPITCAVAPSGLGTGAPLLLGLADGRVARLT
jgi:hypothetical protein